MENNYVIVRADKAGVFFGILKEKTNDTVTLENCRKLYYWAGAAAIEQISLNGINPDRTKDCKFTVTVKSMEIANWNQIIPCSQKAVDNIIEITEWKC
jgi:hypothetical protein